MNAIWALVPVKPFARAKSRLAPLLSAAERAGLAAAMTADVLAALTAARGLGGIALLAAPEATALAQAHGCRLLVEDPALDLLANLAAAAARLGEDGAGGVVIVPTDLPTLAPADVETLLAALGPGVTVVPADRDGGTNALGLVPTNAAPCRFGPDSARLHLEAARERDVPARRLDLAAFARDVDTADDVRWLCTRPGTGHTRDYLVASGLCARLDPRQERRTA
ncbi:MAG: 2-phospho-L-lactate guanylyltransferase [Gammaproteobacteria bacterium]|nr:2-phospho-L-lactate guanylyltransferase [Gammaproteobacteria bacterium]